jgi:hypothetical protein
MKNHPLPSFYSGPLLPPLMPMRLSPLSPPPMSAPSSASTTENPAKRRYSSEPDSEGSPHPTQRLRSDWLPPPSSRPKARTGGRHIIIERTATNHLNDADTGPVPMSTSTGPTSARAPATVPADSPYVRRKRAIAACQFCRLRKTKCDNGRPVCGSCRHHKARCVYADGSEADGLQVGFDEAASRHREVLERLDDIRNLLALSSPSDARSNSAASEMGSRLSGLSALTGNSLGHESAGLSAVETESLPDRQPLSSAKAYLQYTKCEAILKWPVFRGVILDEDAAIDSFIFDAHVRGDGEEHEVAPTPSVGDSASPASCGGASQQARMASFFDQRVREQAFVPLCQKFLALVNCRNPILDDHDLLSYARSVAEDGPGWDAKSCIVVSLTPTRLPTYVQHLSRLLSLTHTL